MKQKLIFLIACIGFIGYLTDYTKALAQDHERSNRAMPEGKAQLIGSVIDSKTGGTMEYANVVLYSLRDSSIITGGVTDKKGNFNLEEIPYGRYLVRVKFIGYQIKEIAPVMLNPRNELHDLGAIALDPDMKNLQEIEVRADESPVLYMLDKKVVKVSSNLNASGGSAVDALENTPSVNVDIEGNVTLRGSSSFTVLVDGVPSAFQGSDALEMIPSSTIDRIEVITNPSAKYDPEGTAGIINVITKKKALDGFSGLVNTSFDTQGSLGADFLLNYKAGKVSYYIGANYRNSVRDGYRESNSYTIFRDTSYFKESKGDRNGGHDRSGIKLGFDYSINPKTILSFDANYGQMSFRRDAFSNYSEWTVPGLDTLFSLSDDFSERNRQSTSLNATLNHKFNDFGHELKLSAHYDNGNGDELNGTDQMDLVDEQLIYGSSSTEKSTEEEMQFKADYTLPLTEKSKFEAGYQLESTKQTEKYEINYTGISSDEYTDFGSLLNSEYHRNIHAIYSLYSNQLNDFGFQLGLRGEYTDRLLKSLNDNKDYTINRFDYFPTLHLSYQLPFDQQVMASYARRIHRPRNYYLEPFITWRDAYTIWQGNPELLPEYIDSYELSYQKKFGMNYISLEGFFRQTNNLSERVQSVYSENVMLHSVQNVGKDYSAGSELMLNWTLKPWWKINLSSSVFHYEIDSDVFDTNNKSTNWNARMRSSFSLAKNIKFQVDGNYRGPSVTAQGKSEGFYVFGSALRFDFLDRALSLNLQIRDIFGTGVHEFTSFGDNFYSYNYFQRNGQVVRVSLSYKIHNYKDKKRSDSDMMDSDSGDMDF